MGASHLHVDEYEMEMFFQNISQHIYPLTLFLIPFALYQINPQPNFDMYHPN